MAVKQFELVFLGEEYQQLRGIVRNSYRYVRNKYPPVEGEGYEEWHQFIKDETLLEIAARLTDIATKRQKFNIELNYKDETNDR